MYIPIIIPIDGNPQEVIVPTIIANFTKISLVICVVGAVLLIFDIFSMIVLEKENNKLYRIGFGVLLIGMLLLIMGLVLIVVTGEKP